MSRIHCGYFQVGSLATGLEVVSDLNRRHGLSFEASSYSFRVEPDGSLSKVQVGPRSLSRALIDSHGLNGNAISEWGADAFSVLYGFVRDGPTRILILEIAESSIERMNLWLSDAGSNFLEYLADAFRSLEARSFVMGPELEFADALTALHNGQVGGVDVRIRAGETLVSKGSIEEKTIDIKSVPFGIRWMPGLDL